MSNNNKRARQDIIQHSRAHVSGVQVEDEKTGFGSGIPDVSLFSQYVDENKTLSPDQFLKDYSPEQKGRYVNELSFDPLQAKYFDMFMDPSKRPTSDHGKKDDMSFSKEQIAAFKRNGFVVTTEEESMGWAYYKVFNNDLPVLVTTDSILHAFHKSYDVILEQLEASYCSKALKKTFEGMRQSIKELAPKFPDGPFQQSFIDADYFLTVGANLLNAEEYYRAGTPEAAEVAKKIAEEAAKKYSWERREYPQKEQIPTILGADGGVENALKACKSFMMLEVNLFGKQRMIDFTLFKPRGHYAKSEVLRRYFRAMSWLGEIDMIIAGDGSNQRQLGAAVVLHMLLNHNEETVKEFTALCRIIEALVGPTNSMDPQQLGILLNSVFKLKTFESINSDDALTKLQAKLLETDLGVKGYNNGNFRSFTFMGKKFTLDSWAQTRFVHDDKINNQIMWEDSKVERHSTSSVEVAFAVLGNDASTSIIHERITNQKSSNKFRDGLMYQHHLVSARKVVDSLPADAWSGSIFMYWLAALRQLSVPLDTRYPQAMRTKAYAMKNMNSQLGSWTQLRHDNILYVEQPRRSMTCCDYPDGYVEPFVEFWQAMERMCVAAAEVMRLIAVSNPKSNRNSNDPRVDFFINFAKHAKVLREISVLELANQPLLQEHTDFLKSVVERYQTFGSGAGTYWLGWYPSLFYAGETDVTNPDLISCDTFTNPPSDFDPGCVVHQTLGYPRRMLMAVENGTNSTVYSGPVFGFYEFELPGVQRMSDEEWKAKVKAKQTPPPPEWTSSYLISA